MVVADFLETITLLDAQNGVKRETALHEGRQDLSVVLAALEHGHPCLRKPILIGEGQRTFLQLACEGMGMSAFLRAEHKTVHPKVLASFIKEYLYPEDPPESLISDDDLRYMVERFGPDDYTVKGRVLKIIANRKDRRAGESVAYVHERPDGKMSCMDKARAIRLLNELIKLADVLPRERGKYDAWKSQCETVIDAIFGPKSKQLRRLESISFECHELTRIGDRRPHDLAFERGVVRSKELLNQLVLQIEEFGVPTASASSNDALDTVELICNRFPIAVRQLKQRREGRPTLEITDEYDVQDLMHTLLRLHFDDIRPEEWGPSHAGKSARMDFLLKREQLVIEVKKTREGLDAKRIGDELIVDIERYQKHLNCKTLVCFIYDPEARIDNPAGVESDLERQLDGFTVKVIIAPKGA